MWDQDWNVLFCLDLVVSTNSFPAPRSESADLSDTQTLTSFYCCMCESRQTGNSYQECKHYKPCWLHNSSDAERRNSWRPSVSIRCHHLSFSFSRHFMWPTSTSPFSELTFQLHGSWFQQIQSYRPFVSVRSSRLYKQFEPLCCWVVYNKSLVQRGQSSFSGFAAIWGNCRVIPGGRDPGLKPGSITLKILKTCNSTL